MFRSIVAVAHRALRETRLHGNAPIGEFDRGFEAGLAFCIAAWEADDREDSMSPKVAGVANVTFPR